MNTAIQATNMSFGYQSNTEIFNDVTFSIQAGEFVTMIGPNGGGKTTLVKLMLGLLEPTGGRIDVFGHPATDASNLIGYLAQDTGINLDFPVTVFDVVRMGGVDIAGFCGAGSSASKQAAIHALQAVNMIELKNKAFSSLSGGQRQRVLIARALAARPKMLLLDEPTSNLDSQVGMEFYELLNDLNHRGMTIVMVSHDKEFVSEHVRKVICVHRKVAVHPTEQWDTLLEADIYGGPVRRVRHDHDCLTSGCEEGAHE